MSGKGAKAAGSVLSKLIKKPWEYTGPQSHPEFLPSLTKPGKYRPFAPTNAPSEVIIPQAESERIFDIKYFNRDHRREDLAPKSEKVPLSALMAAAADVEVPPPPAPYYWYGEEFPLDDTPGEGYQK